MGLIKVVLARGVRTDGAEISAREVLINASHIIYIEKIDPPCTISTISYPEGFTFIELTEGTIIRAQACYYDQLQRMVVQCG